MKRISTVLIPVALLIAIGKRLLATEQAQRVLGAHSMMQRIKDWPAPEQFCSVHRTMEPITGAYTDCYECGHVYPTYEDLREAHAQTYRNIGGSKQIGIITYCPLCLHDL